MTLRNNVELANTREQLAQLEARVEALRRESGDDPERRDATIHSLTRSIDQLKEVIALYQIRHPTGGEPLLPKPHPAASAAEHRRRMSQRRDRRRSYRIATRDPVAVFYEPFRDTAPICIENTVPFTAAAVFLSPEEALAPEWVIEMVNAGADWFLSVVRRMAAGEHISLEEVAQAYLEVNGTAMVSFQEEIDAESRR